MHPILERQLKQIFGEHVTIAPQWRAFLQLVSDTYTHLDEDRALLNRSLDLSSKEFQENNRRLEETRINVQEKAQRLERVVAVRTKELQARIAELEDVRKAATNLLEDIEEKQKALSEAKATDEAILASIGDGMIATDQNTRVIFMNEAIEKLIGWKKEEVIGKSWFEITPMEDEKGNAIPDDKRPLKEAISLKKSTTSIYYFVRKDKTKFPVAITATPIILNGEVIGAIGVYRDITHEKEIDKAKTEFVSLVSHQLRTPLSTINWYAEMLLSGDAGQVNENQKKYLEEAYKASKRMVELVNALLNVSQLELGTFVVEPEPTDVVEVAKSCIKELNPQISEKKLVLQEKYDPDIPSISADPKLLTIVFDNLLSNAVKYTPDGGSIKLSISKANGQLSIVVADTGYGIPKNQQDKIFSKIFRADNVREQDTEGTGLGLYIVKAIIDHSGGKISFESEENKGATFYVTLSLEGMKKKEGTRTLG